MLVQSYIACCVVVHTCENHQRPALTIVPKGAQQQAELKNGYISAEVLKELKSTLNLNRSLCKMKF